MMKMKTNKYQKTTQQFIKKSLEYLTKRYGEVKAEWELLLYLYADNMELYAKIKEQIETDGIYDKRTGRKHPLLSTLKDLQATMMKQVQHLGLSPYAASKIKQAEEDDSELLNAIMGNE